MKTSLVERRKAASTGQAGGERLQQGRRRQPGKAGVQPDVQGLTALSHLSGKDQRS